MGESKYENDVCPFCEKPIAKDEQNKEWDHLWEAAGRDEDDPALQTWADKWCWDGWDHVDVELQDRLVEVLEQRDALRAENERLRSLLGKTAQEATDNALRYVDDAAGDE